MGRIGVTTAAAGESLSLEHDAQGHDAHDEREGEYGNEESREHSPMLSSSCAKRERQRKVYDELWENW